MSVNKYTFSLITYIVLFSAHTLSSHLVSEVGYRQCV